MINNSENAQVTVEYNKVWRRTVMTKYLWQSFLVCPQLFLLTALALSHNAEIGKMTNGGHTVTLSTKLKIITHTTLSFNTNKELKIILYIHYINY